MAQKVYTDKNSCGDSKTRSIMTRWEFSLTYMVLYGTVGGFVFTLHYLSSIKVGLFCLKLNISSSRFAPLPTRQSQVVYSSVEKSRDCCPCVTFLNSIREIHIAVGSFLFFSVRQPEWSQHASGPFSPWCCSSGLKHCSQSLSPFNVPTAQQACHASVDPYMFLNPSIVQPTEKQTWCVSVCKQILRLDLWVCASEGKNWCTQFESSPEHSACVCVFFFLLDTVQMIFCNMFILYLQ